MKRILSLALAAILVFSLSACNSADKPAGTGTTNTPTTTVAATAPSTGDTTDDSTETTSAPDANTTTEPQATTSAINPSKLTSDTIKTSTSTTKRTSVTTTIKCVNCIDNNKDNKCDLCSAKMDFVTAYKNAGKLFLSPESAYDGNPSLFLRIIHETVASRANVQKSESNFEHQKLSYYSAQEFEQVVHSLFAVDDKTIEELRKLKADQIVGGSYPNYTFNFIPVYDGKNETYFYCHIFLSGGSWDPYEYLGYKQLNDTEYVIYIDRLWAITCTYTNTVKISNVEKIASKDLPSDLLKFE